MESRKLLVYSDEPDKMVSVLTMALEFLDISMHFHRFFKNPCNFIESFKMSKKFMDFFQISAKKFWKISHFFIYFCRNKNLKIFLLILNLEVNPKVKKNTVKILLIFWLHNVQKFKIFK
jgi:hypothetical protein